jgi:hypothetical protein
MDCCKNDLGEFPHTEDVDTGINVDPTGVYKLRFTGPNFTRFEKNYHYTSGHKIVIPKGVLNEDFTYSLEIIKPDGSTLSQNDCSNFVLRTFINIKECDDDIDYI